eukprot:25200-Eustigmatos_ZCMA.PRE.1
MKRSPDGELPRSTLTQSMLRGSSSCTVKKEEQLMWTAAAEVLLCISISITDIGVEGPPSPLVP